MSRSEPPPGASRGPIPASVVEALPMPVLLTRASDDVVVTVNRELTEAYGHTVPDVRGRPARELHYVEDDRDLALDQYRRGDLASVEVRVRDSEGECRWAQADVALFEYEDEPVLLTTLYDISDKKRVQEELSAGRALLEEMARFPEMNPGPVARLDRDGEVLRANAAAEALMGLESLEGRPFTDLVPGVDGEMLARLVDDGQSITVDAEIGDRWISMTLLYEPGSDHIFVYGTDVTAQRTAERELAERARFPQMNPGPVARLAPDGRVLRANAAARRVFGLDSLEGEQFRQLCPGLGDPLWARILEGGPPLHHEADIGERCYDFALVHEPKADQVFVYGQDVTELKVAERALAELARFPDMNPGPVVRLDRRANVVLANPAARRVFASEDLKDRSWMDLCPGVDEAFWETVLDATDVVSIEAGIGKRSYLFHHAPGPEGLFVFVYGADVTDQKNAESALRQSEKMATLGTLAAGVAHELNNPAAAVQRAAEQLESAFDLLQKSQLALRDLGLDAEAEALLKTLDAEARAACGRRPDLDPLDRSDRESELEAWLEERGAEAPWEVASALVDLGYDVASLDSLVERGAGAHAAPIAAWQANAHLVYALLDEIRQGSSRLVEIVGAMKAYAYLGQAPVQSVDINEGLQNTLVILRSKLKQGVTVTQDFDPELPRIEAYGGELNQVWTNLLDNAVDAMDGSGRITLRTRAEDGRIVVQVEDDGPGIPQAIQSRVYDAFFTTKPPGRGTGLGLNTTYKVVVEKHGGSIDLESSPGRTCFTVTLPVTQARSGEA